VLAPFPERDALIDRVTGLLKPPYWPKWFRNLYDTVSACPERLQTVSLTVQGASIATTPIPLQNFPQGVYRVTWYARITRAATVSSDLTIHVGFLDDTVACAVDGAVGSGNTTATWHSGTVVITSDLDGPITYSTTYASVGATSMQYKLTIVLERVP
jgi:hypothetical protein